MMSGMGNREALMAAAKQCLQDKGYARTTIRDIATTAGVSMAAVGYHYGSTETLLNAALIEALDELGAEFGRALMTGADPDRPPSRSYKDTWDAVIKTFTQNRSLWLASVEAFLQAQHTPELRDQLAAGQQDGREGLAALLGGDSTADTTRSLGSVQLALLTGVMMQWLIEPKNAPTSTEIIDGLRALANIIEEPAAS